MFRHRSIEKGNRSIKNSYKAKWGLGLDLDLDPILFVEVLLDKLKMAIM